MRILALTAVLLSSFALAQPPAAPAAKAPPSTIRYGRVAPLPKTPGAIRVTTFNIENLFDDKDDPALSGTFDDKTATKPAAHLQAAADAIRKLDADVLCLEEVESLEALTWFRDTYLKGLGYDHISSSDAGDPRGIEQSVLSRFPLKDAKVYLHKNLGGAQPAAWGRTKNKEAGKPFEFKRSPLQVTIEIPSAAVSDLCHKAGITFVKAPDAYRFTVLVCHLKSGGRDYEPQRSAEAGGVIALVKDLENADPAANVLILGDMNSLIIHEPLVKFGLAGLAGIWDGRAAKDALTITHTTNRCIDHIFYNRNITGELLLPTRFVLGMPARPENSNPDTTPAPAGYASDHYPVSIDLKPMETPTPGIAPARPAN